MADDIVERLRTHLVKRDGTPRTHWEGCIDSHPICALAWALDEIERLRAAGDALASFARVRMPHVGWTTADRDAAAAVLDKWKEARRG